MAVGPPMRLRSPEIARVGRSMPPGVVARSRGRKGHKDAGISPARAKPAGVGSSILPIADRRIKNQFLISQITGISQVCVDLVARDLARLSRTPMEHWPHFSLCPR